jgi:hypothetical protein
VELGVATLTVDAARFLLDRFDELPATQALVRLPAPEPVSRSVDASGRARYWSLLWRDGCRNA